MEVVTPPRIETLDEPRARVPARRAAHRLAWIGLDLIAVAGFAVYALFALL
jgi:hypothetical protein